MDSTRIVIGIAIPVITIGPDGEFFAVCAQRYRNTEVVATIQTDVNVVWIKRSGVAIANAAHLATPGKTCTE